MFLSLYFSVCMYSLVVLSSLVCAFINYHRKAEVIQSFVGIDNLLLKKLQHNFDYSKLNNRRQVIFVVVWLASIGHFGLILLSYYKMDMGIFQYGCQAVVLDHAIQIALYQHMILACGVQLRLQAVAEEFKKINQECDLENLNTTLKRIYLNNKKFEKKDLRFCQLQEVFIELLETKKLVNRCFRLPLLCNLLRIYGSIVINFYWLGLAFLGTPHAKVAGKEDLDNYE